MKQEDISVAEQNVRSQILKKLSQDHSCFMALAELLIFLYLSSSSVKGT